MENSEIEYCKSIDAVLRGHRIKNYKDLDIALKKDEEILEISYEGIEKVLEFNEIKNNQYNLRGLLDISEKIYIGKFNVVSREKEFGIFSVKVEKINLDLKSYIEDRSGLKIKDKFDLLVFKLIYELGEEYRVIPFRIGKEPKINKEIFIDTHYEGIILDNDIRIEDIIEYNFDIENYMEFVLLIREINSLNSIYNNKILCKKDILTPDKRKIKNPIVYKLLSDESILIEFYAEIINDFKNYNCIRLERVKFEKSNLSAITVKDFELEKIYKIKERVKWEQI